MAKDIFGYEKTTNTGGVLNFSEVAVSIDSEQGKAENKIYLVQQARLQYRRTVTPVMAAGTSTIFLSPQPGTGEFAITRAIGDATGNDPNAAKSGNVGTKFRETNHCKINKIKVFKVEGNGCASTPNCNIAMDGMLTAFDFQLNVAGQGVSVTDGATYTVVSVDVQ